MTYLQEHVDAILCALRTSGDVLARAGASWETTAWTRSMADATRLWQMLCERLDREVDAAAPAAELCIGLVRRPEEPAARIKWGVLVKLARR